MEYEVYQFENFKEFKKSFPKLAKELSEVVGDGKWKDYGINFYPTLKDYAIYEVVDGYYYCSDIDLNKDLRGAPNLLDYIDFEKLGNDLKEKLDDGTYVGINNGVITTYYGW